MPDTAAELKPALELSSSPASTFQLWKVLVRPYFIEPHPQRRAVWCRSAVIVACCLANTGLFVVISYAQRQFSTTLSGKDKAGFHQALLKFTVILLFACPFFGWYQYAQRAFCLHWRQWMTERLLRAYFADENHYFAALSGVDNPDQRLTEDIRSFVDRSVTYMITLLSKVLSMLAFCSVLWTISPVLVLVLLAYSLVGTAAAGCIFGSLLKKLAFEVLRREADLRFALVRVREHAESIAFYVGGSRELSVCAQRLASLLETLREQIVAERSLSIFQNGYEYATLLVPSLVIAPRYFAGEVDFGSISQASMAFRIIRDATAILVDKYAELSEYSAIVLRLHTICATVRLHPPSTQATFAAAPHKPPSTATLPPRHPKSPRSSRHPDFELRHLSKDGSAEGSALLVDSDSDGPLSEGPPASLMPRRAPSADGIVLSLREVDVATPASRGPANLVSRLSLTLRAGDRVLCVGPSGAGKSSLLRVIAGLWHCAGEVQTPPRSFFLPQSPYMVLGSLREQLGYPRLGATLSAEDACATLRTVGLGKLEHWLWGEEANEAPDWASMLSTGEQQRLAFARLLLHAPPLALLDEATSALDLDNERRMYEALGERLESYVSVGHRLSLVAFHTHVLQLRGDGTWKLASAEAYLRESESRSPRASPKK